MQSLRSVLVIRMLWLASSELRWHRSSLMGPLLAVLGLLSGCTDSTRIEPLAADAVILAFGDSLTTGVGARPDESYPTVLAGLSERRVINAGVSGERTAGGLQRLPQVLAKASPDLLILLQGGNDILRSVNLNDTRANLAAMIELAQAQNIPVLLVGVPEFRLLSGAAPFYDELADEYDVIYEPALLGRLLRRPRYKSDPIHLNAAGYRELAMGLDEVLRDHGLY